MGCESPVQMARFSNMMFMKQIQDKNQKGHHYFSFAFVNVVSHQSNAKYTCHQHPLFPLPNCLGLTQRFKAVGSLADQLPANGSTQLAHSCHPQSQDPTLQVSLGTLLCPIFSEEGHPEIHVYA